MDFAHRSGTCWVKRHFNPLTDYVRLIVNIWIPMQGQWSRHLLRQQRDLTVLEIQFSSGSSEKYWCWSGAGLQRDNPYSRGGHCCMQTFSAVTWIFILQWKHLLKPGSLLPILERLLTWKRWEFFISFKIYSFLGHVLFTSLFTNTNSEWHGILTGLVK